MKKTLPLPKLSEKKSAEKKPSVSKSPKNLPPFVKGKGAAKLKEEKPFPPKKAPKKK